jgi:hypothetical protein
MWNRLRGKISDPKAKAKRIFVETGNLKKLVKLLKSNPTLDVTKLRFDGGLTSLQLSVSNDFLPVAAYLIEHCYVDIDDISNSGKTALHIACEFEKIDSIKFLIRHGACLDIKDAVGKTAPSYCNTLGTHSILTYCNALGIQQDLIEAGKIPIDKGVDIDATQKDVVKRICFETGSVKDLHNLLNKNPKIDPTKMKFVSNEYDLYFKFYDDVDHTLWSDGFAIPFISFIGRNHSSTTGFSLCMCIHMYVYIYMYVHIYTYINIYVYIHMCLCVFIYRKESLLYN